MMKRRANSPPVATPAATPASFATASRTSGPQPKEDYTGDIANDVMMRVMDMLDGDADLAVSAMLLASADLLGMGDLPGFDAPKRAATLTAALLAADVLPASNPLIRIVPVVDGVAMRFESTPRPMAERTVSSMDVARAFAIAMHEAHGWRISEALASEPKRRASPTGGAAGKRSRLAASARAGWRQDGEASRAQPLILSVPAGMEGLAREVLGAFAPSDGRANDLG